MRERDSLAAGLPPGAAREEALARFGDPGKVARWLREHDTRQLRRHRRIELMSDLLQDARYGLRRLWQAPGFTLAVVVVLGLGIGATTAIFSVLDAALAALWLGRFLSGLIFGVGTTDLPTFASVSFLLITTALLASMVPALRAARLDPASVLRSE